MPFEKKYGARTTPLLPTLIDSLDSATTVVDSTRNTSFVVELTTLASHRPGPIKTKSVSAPTQTAGDKVSISAVLACEGVRSFKAVDAAVRVGKVLLYTVLSVVVRLADAEATTSLLGRPFRTVPAIGVGKLAVGASLFVTSVLMLRPAPDLDLESAPDVPIRTLTLSGPEPAAEPPLEPAPPVPAPVGVGAEPDDPVPPDEFPPVSAPVDVEAERPDAIGVAAAEAAEAADVPPVFVAVDVNVYDVPFVKPVTTHDVSGTVTVQVRPPGDAVTVYDTGVPPADGATIVTVT